MNICPHCVHLALAATGVAIPFIPSVLRNLKGKFFRQRAMVENFGILYGKSQETNDGR